MSNLASFILSIDVCSRHGSIAVARAGRLAALWGVESDSRQSSVLTPDIDLLLGRLGATIEDVTAFAVTRGPGGFTGIRVGLASVAGLARATGVPVFGATVLEVVARAGGVSSRTCVVQNAYRNEVYFQDFSVTADGAVDALGPPEVLAPSRVFASLGPGPLRIVGSGARDYRTELMEAADGAGVGVSFPSVAEPLAGGWQVAPEPVFLAGELAALTSFQIDKGLVPDAVEPLYVRPSEAEINLGLGRIGSAGAARIG